MSLVWGLPYCLGGSGRTASPSSVLQFQKGANSSKGKESRENRLGCLWHSTLRSKVLNARP